MSLKVVVIDDSSAVRMAVTMMLQRHPGVEVIGAVRSGEEAEALCRRLSPDLVTMDLHLPGKDGVSALKSLRVLLPDLRAVMMSSEPTAEVKAVLRRQAVTATQVVQKPTGAVDFTTWFEAELGPALARWVHEPRREPQTEPAAPQPVVRNSAVEVILMAASTGGPEALRRVLEGIPVEIGVPVLIVQHMPAAFTSVFANNLNQRLPWRVVEARAGATPAPGQVTVASGGYHLEVERENGLVRVLLTETEALHGCRPAADRLFLTAARVYGPRAIAAVLTGMGRDGATGALALRAQGATVLAQDKESSTVWGMPGAVVGAGAADQVLPLDLIGPTLARLVAERANRRA